MQEFWNLKDIITIITIITILFLLLLYKYYITVFYQIWRFEDAVRMIIKRMKKKWYTSLHAAKFSLSRATLLSDENKNTKQKYKNEEKADFFIHFTKNKKK